MQTAVSVQNDAYLIVLSTEKVLVYKQIVPIIENNKIMAIELT